MVLPSSSEFMSNHEGTEMTYPCEDCGYVLRYDYVMPNDLWLDVIGQHEGIYCYDCFCARAEKKGYIPVFKCELVHSHSKASEK